jgi:hypothetical protein
MTVPSGYIANPSGTYSKTDGTGPFVFDGTNMVFQGVGLVKAYSSGTIAAVVCSASIPAASGQTNYCTGFEITASGATAAIAVAPTVTGLLGGTATYAFTAPAGATAAANPLVVTFNPPIPASAANTAITVSCPALGAGNTNTTVVVHGFTM